MFFFDAMLNGSELEITGYADVSMVGNYWNRHRLCVYKKIPQKVGKILDKLIKHRLKQNENENEQELFDPYIIDTFNLFCDHKKIISINYAMLTTQYQTLRDLIMFPVIANRSMSASKDDPLNINLFKPFLFKIFPNLKEITMDIHTTQGIILHPKLKYIGIEIYTKEGDFINRYGFSFRAFNKLYYNHNWKASTKVIVSCRNGIFVRKYLRGIKHALSGFKVSVQQGIKQKHEMEGIAYQEIVNVDNLIIERKQD